MGILVGSFLNRRDCHCRRRESGAAFPFRRLRLVFSLYEDWAPSFENELKNPKNGSGVQFGYIMTPCLFVSGDGTIMVPLFSKDNRFWVVKELSVWTFLLLHVQGY